MDMTSDKLQTSINNILDCFGGADGGVGFARLKILVEQLEKQADAGDDNAERVIQVVHQFSRLIDVANKK